MEDNSTGAIEELTHIKTIAVGVHTTLDSYSKTMGFVFKRPDLKALRIAVDNLHQTSTNFMENLKTLEDYVRLTTANIRLARKQVLVKKLKALGKNLEGSRRRTWVPLTLSFRTLILLSVCLSLVR